MGLAMKNWLISCILLGVAVVSGSRFAGAEEIDYWEIESAEERAALPEYVITEAAPLETLTSSNGHPTKAEQALWQRSHGGDYGQRYSPTQALTPENVADLEVAWTYHPGGAANIQCNPIIVGRRLFTPVPGNSIVALDAVTGTEIWRYEAGGSHDIAWRGLTYWEGNDRHPPSLFFCAGDDLVSLDPETGNERSRRFSGHFRVAPIITDDLVILAGFEKDVFAFDLATGDTRWVFHTIPQPGELGFETWDRIDQGANCWGGMSFDRERKIVFITTGSPKPNYVGVRHRGANLYSNCVVAIDALTGQRRWHFQEIPHDIWDLDLPAPPILVNVDREGKEVDAVAVVSKTGNTLLLDRLTGQPLFPFRWRRAPVSLLPGEQTWPFQPAPVLPEPFSRQIFSSDEVTDLSEEARFHILSQIRNARYGGFFDTFENGRPTVYFGVHGGAEWTGGCFDPETGFLYVSSNDIPWIITLTSSDEPPIDEATLDPTAGRAVYETFCIACHGANREGVGVNPGLQGLRHRLQDEEVESLLETGRNLMPPQPWIEGQARADLMNYLFDRDREPKPATEQVAERPERPDYLFGGFEKLLDHEGYPGSKPPWGTLNCLDLNTGQLRWQVPLGEHEELTARGIPKTGTENFGGPSVTAGGLVFCSGTRDRMIRAFSAQTGEELWKHSLPFHGTAPPTIYEVAGIPYLVIPATGGGKLGGPIGDSFVAFSLPAK